MLSAHKAIFATLIALKVHDGIEGIEDDAALTLVDKMALLWVKYMEKGSYALLDAYYASVKVLAPFRDKGIHLISRVRITTVAHAAFSRRPGKYGPGRHRQWVSPRRFGGTFLCGFVAYPNMDIPVNELSCWHYRIN